MCIRDSSRPTRAAGLPRFESDIEERPISYRLPGPERASTRRRSLRLQSVLWLFAESLVGVQSQRWVAFEGRFVG